MNFKLKNLDLISVLSQNIYAVITIGIFFFINLINSISRSIDYDNTAITPFTIIFTIAAIIIHLAICDHKRSIAWKIISISITAISITITLYNPSPIEEYNYGIFFLMLLLIAPSIKIRTSNSSFFSHIYQWGKDICISGIIATTLYILSLLLIAFISILFEDISNSIILNFLYNICFDLVFPLFIIIIHSYNQKSISKKRGIFNIIISYIFLPMVAVASIIPYVFVLKIILLGKIPNGEIAYTLSTYLVFAFIAQALASIMDEGLFLKKFFKYIHYSLILPLLLVIISLSTRIDHYGLTSTRVMLHIGLLFMALLIFQSIIWKDKNRIFMLWIGAALLAIFTYIPYISSNDIANRSQLKVLNESLYSIDIVPSDSIHWREIVNCNDSIACKKIYSAYKYLDSTSLANNNTHFKGDYETEMYYRKKERSIKDHFVCNNYNTIDLKNSDSITLFRPYSEVDSIALIDSTYHVQIQTSYPQSNILKVKIPKSWADSIYSIHKKAEGNYRLNGFNYNTHNNNYNIIFENDSIIIPFISIGYTNKKIQSLDTQVIIYK